MSEVALTILDSEREVSGHVHGSDAECLVAALAAEPETIGELEAAMARFVGPDHAPLAGFRAGGDEEPWDAGLVVIDLAARLVAHETTYDYFGPQGQVLYRGPMSREIIEEIGDDEDRDVWIPFQLPDDWLFVNHILGWEALAQRRRQERAALPPLDARAALYGAVSEFIVNQCLTAGRDESATAIHARWLMTPREDLRGVAPRDSLLERHHFVDLDLQWRAMQWSFTGFCPSGLAPESPAYLYGGFGTHEIVLYYEMVRHLIEVCQQRLGQDAPAAQAPELISELQRRQRAWLHEAQRKLYGMSPFVVIGHERARLPMAVGHAHFDLDDDCEICQMMRELPGPMFWHLDGCNMDDDFAFSFHRTREEWEAEQREWEEHSRRWRETDWTQRDAGDAFDETDPLADD